MQLDWHKNYWQSYNKLIIEGKLICFADDQKKAFGVLSGGMIDSQKKEEEEGKKIIAKILAEEKSGDNISQINADQLRINRKYATLAEKASIDALTQKADVKIEEIIKKPFKKLRTDEIKMIAIIPPSYFLDKYRDKSVVKLKYLKIIKNLILAGKPPKDAQLAKNNVQKEVKGEFKKHYASSKIEYDQLTDLEKTVNGKSREDVLTKISDQFHDAAIAQAEVKSMPVQAEKTDLVTKWSPALKAIEKVLGADKVLEVQATLRNEGQEAEEKVVIALRTEIDKHREKVIHEGSLASLRETERSFKMVFEVLESIPFKDSQFKAEIIAEFQKQQRMINDLNKIFHDAQGKRENLLEILAQKNWLEGYETEPAKLILKTINELNADLNNLHVKHQQAQTIMFRVIDEKRELTAEEKELFSALFKDDKLPLIYEKIKSSNNHITADFLEDSVKMTEKYGLSHSQINDLENGRPIYKRLDIPRERDFLKYVFKSNYPEQPEDSADKFADLVEKNEFLNELFRAEGGDEMITKQIKAVFDQLSKFEELTLDMLTAPSLENIQNALEQAKKTTLSLEKALKEEAEKQIQIIDQLLKSNISTEDQSKLREAKNNCQKHLLVSLKDVIPHIDVQKYAGNDLLLRKDLENGLKPVEYAIEKAVTDLNDLRDQNAYFESKLKNDSPDTERESSMDIHQYKPEKAEEYFMKNTIHEEDLATKPFDISSISTLDFQRFRAEKIGEHFTKKESQEMEAELDERTIKFMELKDVLLALRNNQEIDWQKIHDLKNVDDTPVFHPVMDAKWDKKMENKRGQIEEKNGIFKIYIKQSEFDNPQTIKHEIAHAVDFFTGEAGNRHLINWLKQNAPDKLKKWREEFKKDNPVKDADFAREMFAHLLGQDFSGNIGRIAQEMQSELQSRGVNPEQFLPSKEDMEQGLKKKFWQFLPKKRKAAASQDVNFVGAANEDRLKKTRAQYEVLRRVLDKRLDAIEKSGHTDASAFVSSARISADLFKNTIDNNPTEKQLFDIVCKPKDAGEAYMAKLIGSSNEVLRAIAYGEMDKAGIFETLWNSTSFVSFADIGRMWTTFNEYLKRRHESQSKRRAGIAGNIITRNVSKKLATDYDLQKESAEKEEVQKYQDSLSNKDAWQIYDRISSTNNKDELKACIRQLCELGRCDWRSQKIWDAFHRIGVPVRFKDVDRNDMTVLRNKMQKASRVLWDNDEFRANDRKNLSSYESKMGEYNKEVDTMLGSEYGIELLRDLKEMRTKGKENAQVDPTRYEAIIDWCVQKGQMNAEDIIYYLIQGIAEEIISPERAIVFNNKYLNKFPISDYFNSHRPTLEEYKKWGALFRNQEGTDGTPPKNFKVWLNVNFMTDKRIVDRTVKSVVQKDWDHDYMQYISSVGDSASAKQFAGRGYDGTPNFHLTAYPNAINGQLMHMTDVANFSHELSLTELKDWLARQAGCIATLDGILYGRVYNDKSHFQMSSSQKDYKNRIPGYWSQAKRPLKVGEMSERLRNIIRVIAPPFFDKLFELREGSDDQSKVKELGEILKDKYSYVLNDDRGKPSEPPTSVQGMYDLIEPFIRKHLEHSPSSLNDALDEARKTWQEDHPNKSLKDISWDWKSSMNGK